MDRKIPHPTIGIYSKICEGNIFTNQCFLVARFVKAIFLQTSEVFSRCKLAKWVVSKDILT